MKDNSQKRYDGWQKEVLLDILGKSCTWCGISEKLHIHHIIPLSKGGKNKICNLEVVCIKCHNNLHREIEKIMPTKKVIWKKNECHNCREKFPVLRNNLCYDCLSFKKYPKGKFRIVF